MYSMCLCHKADVGLNRCFNMEEIQIQTITALIPGSEEIEVAVVWIDCRGLDGVRAGTLGEGGDSRALERAVRVQLHSENGTSQYNRDSNYIASGDAYCFIPVQKDPRERYHSPLVEITRLRKIHKYQSVKLDTGDILGIYSVIAITRVSRKNEPMVREASWLTSVGCRVENARVLRSES